MTHYGTSRNYVIGIHDNQTNRELVDIADVVELLNMLHEENIKLKAELKNLRRLANEVYMEENE